MVRLTELPDSQKQDCHILSPTRWMPWASGANPGRGQAIRRGPVQQEIIQNAAVQRRGGNHHPVVRHGRRPCRNARAGEIARVQHRGRDARPCGADVRRPTPILSTGALPHRFTLPGYKREHEHKTRTTFTRSRQRLSHRPSGRISRTFPGRGV